MSRSFIKNVFLVVAAVLLAMLLYQLTFGMDNCAFNQMCRAVKNPVAGYYYRYGLYPSVYSTSGVGESLGITYTTNPMGDLTLPTRAIDDSSTVCQYSTGWF